MKNLASFCFAAAIALTASSSFAATLGYSCKNSKIPDAENSQSLVFQNQWLLPSKIVWSSLEGYKITFPGKTTLAEGMDFGFRGHQFESTNLNNSFLGVYVEHTLYVDQTLLKGEESGFVIESTSYGSMPENISSDVRTFTCSRKLD